MHAPGELDWGMKSNLVNAQAAKGGAFTDNEKLF